MIELRRNPSGAIDKRITIRTTLKPPKRQESDSDVSDLQDQIKKAEGDRQIFTKKMKEKEQEMQVSRLYYCMDSAEWNSPRQLFGD